MSFIYELLDDVDRINDVAGLFESVDETVGDSHLSGEYDVGRTLFPFAIFLKP